MSDKILISKVGLYETIRCTICKNPNKTERGCDGSCQYDKELHAKIVEAVMGLAEQRSHGECRTCKHFVIGGVYGKAWVCEHPNLDKDDDYVYACINMEANDFCSRYEKKEDEPHGS